MDFAGNIDSSGLVYESEPFTPRETVKHLSLVIIQGLNPSPQLKMKARYQNQEQVQGNDSVASSIGTNIQQIYKQFTRYFSIQHPYLSIPTQKTHPNRKVSHF